MNLISQTWSYAGIEFGVGWPELVATLPEYRQRGLIRTQFEEIHRWSEERGERRGAPCANYLVPQEDLGCLSRSIEPG